jgi:hypothetical protein
MQRDHQARRSISIRRRNGIGLGGGGLALLGLSLALSAGGCPTDMNGGNGGGTCNTGAATGPTTVSYANDIVPLFQAAGCLTAGCHGGSLPSSGYDLRSYASTFVPGDEAESFGLCPIVPGNPDGSYMIEKLRPSPRTGARMPLLGTPLTTQQIELVATWIREGAANN